MDVYAMVIDKTTGRAIPGASVQRYYPEATAGPLSPYAIPLLTGNDGIVDAPIPDRSFYLIASARGYLDTRANLDGALNHRADAPLLIKMLSEAAAAGDAQMVDVPLNGQAPADNVIVETPDNTVWWLAGIVGVGYIFRKDIKKLFH